MKGAKKINENLVAPYRSLTIVGNNLPDNTNWQRGTLKCDPDVSGLKYKSAAGTFDLFDASYILQANTVTSELIKDGTIRTEDLADRCVTNDKIANRTIDHIKLKYQTITADELNNGCVIERTILDKNVTSNKIADYAIREIHFSNACVSNRCLRNDSVSSLNLMDGAVIESKICNEAVTGVKIADEAITYEKIAPFTIIGGENTVIDGKIEQGRIAKSTITNYNIADYTITATNIMTGAIENRCIAEETIDNRKIKPKTIVNSCIADKTITSKQIGDGALNTINYADKSITKVKLSDDIFNVVNNAVVYNDEGDVHMLRNTTGCNAYIGSADVDGNSNGNGSLTVYGNIRADRVYNMAYADLAEGYVPGEELKPGDIVEYREDGKVYKAEYNIPGVIVGIVSDEYAACYGATEEEIKSGEKVAVGLVGRLHVNVTGPTVIGQDIMVSYRDKGLGEALFGFGHKIGKVLETTEEKGIHKVLCLINLS